MLALRLPIELELHILDLAIPPRTFYRAVERIRLCKTLALVHRDWTPRAQHHLAQHILFGVPGSEEELIERVKQIRPVAASGQQILRLDAWQPLDAADPGDATTFILVLRFSGLEELGLRRSLTRLDCAKDRRALNQDLYSRTAQHPPHCPPLHALPPTLRSVTIAHFQLDSHDIAEIVRLPHLHTLLLDGFLDGTEVMAVLASRVKVLGLTGLAATLALCYFPPVSPTIQHIALVGVISVLLAGPAFPPGLCSVSLVAPPSKSSRDEFAGLAVRAHHANVRLNIKHCQAMDEVFGFDLEEWALSVEN